MPPEGPTQASSSAGTAPDSPDAATAGSGATLDLGSADAPLTLLLFTNHACAYCRDFQETILPRLRSNYIDKGTLRLRTALLPIRKYPASAVEAAAVFCAGKQGKGREMHDTLLDATEHSEQMTTAAAGVLRLDGKAFAVCMASPEAAAYAEEQESLAAAFDVTLVPTLILGNEKRVGLPTYADLRGWIENEKAGR